MKTLFLLLFLPLLVFSQKAAPPKKTVKSPSINQAQKGFTITGNLAGLKDSTLIFLSHPSDPYNRVSTAYSKKGAFTLKGQLPYADIYYLSVTGVQDQLELFIDNEAITITGAAQSLLNVKVAGSVVNADYQVYQNRFNPIRIRLNDLSTIMRSTAEGKSRDSLYTLFEAEKKKVVEQVDLFLSEKPASPVSAFITLATAQLIGDINALDNRYSKLNGAAKRNFYAAQIEKAIYDARNPKPGAEGTMAVDFSQPDTASKPVSLFSFKGKYVLVDFWASWCKPCRMENPAVVNAFNRYKNKNFTVLGVSLDQSRENWLQAIKDDNLTWTHVSDLKFWQNEAAQLYGIGSIPANMLIDPKGKIIARDLRGELLINTLEKVLK